VEENADLLMVKPAMMYLDVVRDIKINVCVVPELILSNF
jgi:Delta-aminolevulinic acid dehydratase